MLRRGSNGFRFHSVFACLNSLKKSLILYSTSVACSNDSIASPPMVEFLVKSVGFSEQEAASVLNKVSHPLKCTENSELVVDFLRGSGFDGTQIRKVVALSPDVLRSNVDKTLKPKIRAFEDVGFSGSNLVSFISRNPDILRRNLESSIVPVLGMFKSLLGSNEQVISCLLQIKPQRFFSSQVWKCLPDNMLLLQSYGLTSERIKWLMLKSSFLFLSTQGAEKLVKRVEEKLGIPRTSDMFMYGIHALTLKSEVKVVPWLDIFRSYGWRETDISTLLRKHPTSLGLSENSLRIKLKYYMEDLSLRPDYVASRPAMLTYSMEKRILPRVAVRQTLMEEHLLEHPGDLYRCLMMPESMFMPKYVLPYKEKMPQLYEGYTQATGYSLSRT